MMRKIALFLTCYLTVGLWGCSDFLSETPNKSGSAELYHMDQLLGLTGNSALYRTGSIWFAALFVADGIGFEPYMVTNFATYDSYNVWSGRMDYLLENPSSLNFTWTPTWNAVYTFNTVLENMDLVIQTTPTIRKQVEGEALFGRAYFHFMALVEFALWDENAPGIGYRLNVDPSEIPTRETVKYTLDHIYEDLNNAEAALQAAGRTQFELERNFRPTVPTVKALRARVDLYRGNWASALENANAALTAYSYLHDFKNDPRYEKVEAGTINLLDETNSTIVSSITYRNSPQLRNTQVAWEYEEFYLPHYFTAVQGNFALNTLSISESTLNRFDRENDERCKRFYYNYYMLYATMSQSITLPGNSTPTTNCVTWERQHSVTEAAYHTYQRFGSNKIYFTGPTTAEMYLIKAECLARSGNTSEAAEVLRTLRRTRFTTVESANNIGGTLNEVLEERAREMTEAWRFFDIKRLNGVDNANIAVRKIILTDRSNINTQQEYVLAPNDPGWAIPILTEQIILMGWQQN